MKKILTTIGLTSLASMTIGNIATSSISSAQNKQEINATAQINPTEWHFKEQSIHTEIAWNEYIYCAIDNINLTAIGIKDLTQLHKYNVIDVPDLKIEYRFNDILKINGDKWKTNRNLGSEDWYHQYSEWIGERGADLYTASTLWYDQSGNLMMRLAYKIAFGSYWAPDYARVSIDTGSLVLFY
ncbi:hypothetical protein [Spiroplasma attinicola]|uniref:hypothetical protein n=1 Tax=Spiroplasma attinicola TaxID=2904537 RepID=UPI002022A652|nr:MULTISPECIES: hypothetical protein [unclassified Spiroplasma]MCL8209785.1 hypothetical protein [Spiroplasma sp. JKS002670]MCL8210599.1 hypothetical protein [Spiroplasma sp. JKS002671]